MFRLMTFNVLTLNHDYRGIAASIARQAPDVVGIQELSSAGTQVGSLLSEDYPHQALCPERESKGSGVLSRLPILDHESFTLSPDGNVCQRLVLEQGSRRIVYFNVHLISPKLPGLFSWYHCERRDAESATLAERLRRERDPLVVAGDCNMTSRSKAYRHLTDLLIDSFPEAGKGSGLTHANPRRWRSIPLPRAPVPFPLVRIDYIFHSIDIVAQRAWVGDGDGSDHKPVVAELEIC